MNRYVWIVWLGGGLLGYVAGEMIVEDAIIVRWLGELSGVVHRPLPLAIGAVVTGLGWQLARANRRRRVPENV
jgi:predicted tellurium resistance membrane protein TerC